MTNARRLEGRGQVIVLRRVGRSASHGVSFVTVVPGSPFWRRRVSSGRPVNGPFRRGEQVPHRVLSLPASRGGVRGPAGRHGKA